jgi:hypothetical protein
LKAVGIWPPAKVATENHRHDAEHMIAAAHETPVRGEQRRWFDKAISNIRD